MARTAAAADFINVPQRSEYDAIQGDPQRVVGRFPYLFVCIIEGHANSGTTSRSNSSTLDLS